MLGFGRSHELRFSPVTLQKVDFTDAILDSAVLDAVSFENEIVGLTGPQLSTVRSARSASFKKLKLTDLQFKKHDLYATNFEGTELNPKQILVVLSLKRPIILTQDFKGRFHLKMRL